ncbi:MAG: carbon-nitrogen hydrolase family protein [Saprospiraceae bacterium]|nr:carbon-nitrogen hydrolase family protein [Saprospiraceae bacterium]
MTKIALVQKAPVFLDTKKSASNAVTHINEAAKQDANIIVFGEGWLSGYPAWIDYSIHMGCWDQKEIKQVWAQMYADAIEIDGPEIQSIKEAAKESAKYVVIGANEAIKKGKGNGSLYNTLLIITPEGEIAVHHRKLMPTFNEKLVHAYGDAFGLKTIQTPYGNIGGLICWEHWMPLTRQAMHDEGEDIHFGLWPAVKSSHKLASRHYAFEGRCYVVAMGQILRKNSIPNFLEMKPELVNNNSEFILDGGSCVIDPNGNFILEPQYGREEIIYIDLPPLHDLYTERMNLSTSGHYQRPDVFTFNVDKRRMTD